MKKLKEFASGVLENILAEVVLAVGIPLTGIVYALYAGNPQLVLQIVLVLLIAIDIAVSLSSLKQQKIIQSQMSESLQELSQLRKWFPSTEYAGDSVSRQIQRELEVRDKYFDEQSDPQRIVVLFINRGTNVIHIDKIKYSDNKLPASALMPSYRKEGGGYYIISQDKVEVVPGQEFSVEICLGQKWKREDISRIAGQWGYLRIIVTYANNESELFYSV